MQILTTLKLQMASTTLLFTRLPCENLQCCDSISKNASLRRPFQLTTCDVTAWRPAYGAKHNSSTQRQRPLEPGNPPPQRRMKTMGRARPHAIKHREQSDLLMTVPLMSSSRWPPAILTDSPSLRRRSVTNPGTTTGGSHGSGLVGVVMRRGSCMSSSVRNTLGGGQRVM